MALQAVVALQALVQVCRYGLWTPHGSTLEHGTFSTDALANVQRCSHGEKFAAGLRRVRCICVARGSL